MDFDDELDIDTLADLIDDEDFDQRTVHINSKSTNEATSEHTNSVCKNLELANETLLDKAHKENVKSKAPKLTPIDLFAKESNISDNVSKNSSQANIFQSLVHAGDVDSSDDESKTYLTESGKAIKKKIAVTPSYDKRPPKKIKTWKDVENVSSPKENYVVDEYSGLRIVNPLVSRNLMKNRMVDRKMIKMSFIRNFMQKGSIEGDWVTIGVIVNKIPPKTSKNGKTYSIWKLNDLSDTDKIVSFFLFSAVHTEHWKTAIGSVIGLLNPSFLSDRDGNKSGDVSLSIDHPSKLMLIGTSKDFGHCKGRRKDGAPCTSVVNKSVCEFCCFHVSKEYKKLSGKRVELQATYSGRQPSLQNRILKGQNVMYGGQMFSAPSPKVDTKSKSKDKLTLHSLKFKRKVEELSREEREKVLTSVAKPQAVNHNNPFASQSEFINRQLSIPSIASRNLQQHLSREESLDDSSKKSSIISITPKELLKLHEQKLKERLQVKFKNAVSLPMEFSPKLGKGFKPGDEITFDVTSPLLRKNVTSHDIAKLRAIEKIKGNGIIKKNPNAVKKVKSPDSSTKIKKALEQSKELNEDSASKSETKSLLGTVDVNSEKFQAILNRKSSHHYQVEVEEIEKVETYFRNMEKKEQLEDKMLSTTEIVCDVVSCRQCKYTAHKASDFCKNEGHPLKAHKALKRFFMCTNCKRRTCAFTKIPNKACKNCGEFSFERTSMMKPRSGPKLENEVLNIRGDEIKFLNGLVH